MDLPLMVITMVLFVRIFETGEGCTFGPGCTYECHCEGGLLCDQDTGDCPNGCDDGVLSGRYGYRGAWSGYGCQIGNQAYLKAATQGPSTWPDENDNQAYRAVDGNLNPDLNQDSCVHPLSYNGQDPWWQLDLGAQFVIVSVNITNRLEQERDRLTYIIIEVSQDGTQYHQCAALGDVGEPAFVYVVCDTNVLGKYVRLSRPRSAHDGNAMNFCEDQVYAYQYKDCLDVFFGIACHNTCNCPVTCDYVTGHCSAGCIPGKMGDTCQEDCPPLRWGSNCVNYCGCSDPTEVCDPMDGQCMSGCLAYLVGLSCDIIVTPTWEPVTTDYVTSTTDAASAVSPARETVTPDYFTSTTDAASVVIPARETVTTDYVTPTTDAASECPASLWGSICNNFCGCLDPSEVCNPLTGYCTSGCRQGLTGAACNITITGAATTNTGLSAGAAAGPAVGIILVVLLVAVGVLIWRFQPEFIQKLRERHEPKVETPYNDIYSAIMEGVPSKPLPMGELPDFMKVTKNSQIGFQTEYKGCFTVFSLSI